MQRPHLPFVLSLQILLSCLGSACSSNGTSHSLTDGSHVSSTRGDASQTQTAHDGAGARDADEVSARESILCPGERESCQSSITPTPLLDAAKLGPNARFVAIDGSSVLAHIDANEWAVVRPPAPRYADPSSAPTRTALTLATLIGIDVLDPPIASLESNASRWIGNISVLACDAKECDLFVGEEGVELKTRGALPRGHEKGLTFDMSMGRVCAFGSAGIACSNDGTLWSELALPETRGHTVLDAFIDGPVVLAAGDDGLLYYELDGVKRQQAGFDGIDFVAAAAADGVMAVLDSRGRYYRMQSAEEGFVACGDKPLFAAIPGPDVVVGQLADVWHATPTIGDSRAAFCADPALEVGTVIGASLLTCGIISNPWLLTEGLLVGGTFCAVE